MENALIITNTNLGEVANLTFDYDISLIMFRAFIKLKRFYFSIPTSIFGAGMLYPCDVPAPTLSTSERISHSKSTY